MTAGDVAAESARRAFDAGVATERDRIIQLAYSEAGYAEFHDCPIGARALEDFAAKLAGAGAARRVTDRSKNTTEGQSDGD